MNASDLVSEVLCDLRDGQVFKTGIEEVDRLAPLAPGNVLVIAAQDKGSALRIATEVCAKLHEQGVPETLRLNLRHESALNDMSIKAYKHLALRRRAVVVAHCEYAGEPSFHALPGTTGDVEQVADVVVFVLGDGTFRVDKARNGMTTAMVQG